MRRLNWMGLLMAVLLAAVGAASAQDAGADEEYLDWSADSTQLAFVSNRGGTSDLYIVDAAGGEARQLTDGLDVGYYFRWSPDASQIFFTPRTNAKVLVVSVATGEVTTLMDDYGTYDLQDWSPDGVWLLIQQRVGNDTTLYAYAPTTNERVTISEKFFNYVFGTWSPDGTQIALLGQRIGGTQSSLFIYDVAAQSLSDNVLATYWQPEDERCCVSLVWSPDSTRILLQNGYDPILYDIALADGQILPLAYTGAPIRNQTWTQPERIVYLALAREPETSVSIIEGAAPGLYSLAPDERSPRLIAEMVATWLLVAPDGTRALAVNLMLDDYLGVPQPRSLKLVELATGAVNDLALHETNSVDVVWSPDSTRIAGALCIDGDYDIYVIDALTGDALNVTPDDAFSGVAPQASACEVLG